MLSPIRNKRRLIVLLSALILFILAVSFLPAMYAWWVSPWRQGVTLHVKLIDDEGRVVPYALVRVFLLTDNGPVLLASSGTYRCGEAVLHVFVPRVGDGFMLVPQRVADSWGDKPTYTLIEDTRKPIYASVNLEVFAVGLSPEGKMVGVRVFSLDPTYMKWPEDSASITVKMWRVPSLNTLNSNGSETPLVRGKMESGSGITSEVSWWQYTPILKYGAWDGIKEWYNIRIGSKVEIESKTRACVMYCEPWRSAGSTQVTIDRGLTGGYLTGELVRTLYAEFKYVDFTYCDTFAGICEETVYAADTGMDFPKYEYLDESWDGHLPSSPYVYYTDVGETGRIAILGGYHWDLSVTVGVNVGGEPSVTLGVTFVKVSNPTSFLYIKGEEGYGNTIKTASVHGPGKGSYVVTYSNWVRWG